MKKIILTIAIALISMMASAQTKKVVTDSVAFRACDVQVYEGVTKNGNPKWWIEIPAGAGVKKVTMSESHAKSGRLLALIERYDPETGRYTYSIKFAEPKAKSSGRADLSSFKK